MIPSPGMAAPLSLIAGLWARSVSWLTRPRRGLRRACAVLVCGSLASVACDSETIDLLPPDLSPTAGASGSGMPSGGDAAIAGSTSAGGTASGNGGGGGAPSMGGNPSCVGLGCAGLNFAGFAGSIWTGDCNPDQQDCKLCENDEHCGDAVSYTHLTLPTILRV